MTRGAARTQRAHAGALATAISRDDWERVALYLLLGLIEAARRSPAASIDDVIDALAEEVRDDGGPR